MSSSIKDEAGAVLDANLPQVASPSGDPSVPPMHRGDFACGQRLLERSAVTPDYAAGQRSRSRMATLGHFAGGQASVEWVPELGWFHGGHTRR